MANRVTIRIQNQNYNILAEEDESYIQQCADLVKNELDKALSGTSLSITDGAVLAALNMADKYSKERQVADNLRAQLKSALDENARLAKEVADLKKEAKKAAKAAKEAKEEKK